MHGAKHRRLWGFDYITSNTYNSIRDERLVHALVAENVRYDREAGFGSLRCECVPPSNCLTNACLNKANGFECNLGNCNSTCQNNILQRWDRDGFQAPVTIGVQRGLGLALFSSRSIDEWEIFGEIKGKYESYPSGRDYVDSFFTYQLEHAPNHVERNDDRKLVINTWTQANEFRYLTHNCKPNSFVQQVLVGKQARLIIRAFQEIPANSPVTIHYGDEFFDGGLICRCSFCCWE